MPSGPPELHEKWSKRGPYDSADHNAIRFLELRGWTLHRDWSWSAPTPCHADDPDEISAIKYLIMEWDFGGIRPNGEAFK